MPATDLFELYTAISADNLPAVRALLTDFNINAIDGSGVTPLLMAVRSDAFRVIEYLVAHPQMNYSAQGAQVFEAALRSYYITEQSKRKSLELKAVFDLLRFHRFIDLTTPALTALITANPGKLSDLLQLVAASKKRHGPDYLFTLSNKIEIHVAISRLFADFDRHDHEENWLYQAGQILLQIISLSRHPEPTLCIATTKDMVVALQGIIKHYHLNDPALPVSMRDAYTACLLLARFYLEDMTEFDQAVKYCLQARRLRQEEIICPSFEKFTETVAQHFPENFRGADISHKNSFQNFSHFIIDLKDAFHADSSHARTYLESVSRNDTDMLAMLADSLVKHKFDADENDPLVLATKSLYGIGMRPDYQRAALGFKIIATLERNPQQIFYYYFMSLSAYYKILRNSSEIIYSEKMSALLDSMLVYYTADIDLKYSQDVFGILFAMLSKNSSPEVGIKLLKLVTEYGVILLNSAHQNNFNRVSKKNIYDLFHSILIMFGQYNVYNQDASWSLVVDAINRFTAECQSSPDLINAMLQIYEGMCQSILLQQNSLIYLSLREHLFQLAQAYMHKLTIETVDIMLLNMNALVKSSRKDKSGYIDFMAKLYLRAAELRMAEAGEITPAVAALLDSALRYALYPAIMPVINEIQALLQTHSTLHTETVNTDSLRLASQAIRCGSDTRVLCGLIDENYFPALLQLTYANMQSKNARRGFYLGTRLFAELLFNKDALKEKYLFLTEENMTTYKEDIFRFFAQYSGDAYAKYARLIEWYRHFINHVANLVVTMKMSSPNLDIDALMAGNARGLPGVAEHVRYGMLEALHKDAAYYTLKDTLFIALNRHWEGKIQLQQIVSLNELAFFKPQLPATLIELQVISPLQAHRR